MTRCVRILLAVGLPALALCLSASARGPSEEDEEAQQRRKAAAARVDVLRLADSLDRDEDEIEKQAHAIAEKHDLKSVSWILKLREQGGLGVGDKPGAFDPDGIELQLLVKLGGRKPMAPEDLQGHRDDFLRMAKATLAIARVTPLYRSQFLRPDDAAGKMFWERTCKQMIERSQDLVDALKADDVKTVWKAARRLNQNCNDCHTSYTDP